MWKVRVFGFGAIVLVVLLLSFITPGDLLLFVRLPMRQPLRFLATLLLVAVLLSLIAPFTSTSYSWRVVAERRAANSQEFSTEKMKVQDAVDYYGRLVVPPEFQFSTASTDSVYRVQPGGVLLTDGQHIHRTTVRNDGVFQVKNLPLGSYLLQADWFDFIFPTMRVDVEWMRTGKNSTAIVISTSYNEYPVRLTSGTGREESKPAIITTVGAARYYEPREKFDLMQLIRSPMGIMALVGVGMLILMKMLPEEELKKAQAESKEMKRRLAANAMEGLTGIDSTAKKQKKIQ